MTKGRLGRMAVSALLGAACIGPVVGFADEPSDGPKAGPLAGVWIGPDERVDGWRYVTRYEITVTGDRFQAVGALYIVSPQGLTESRPPTVNEFSGTIDGTVLSGEVSLYRRLARAQGTTVTRPLRGTVDLEQGVIVIQYHGAAPDDTPADEAEKWRDADRSLTLRVLRRPPPRQE